MSLTRRGFNLLELLSALVISLGLISAFLTLVHRNRVVFARNESMASLQDSARHALDTLARDLEHAGFSGFSPGGRFERVSALPPRVHECGINYAVNLARPVQGTDNRYRAATAAADCLPTTTAGGASASRTRSRFATCRSTPPRLMRVGCRRSPRRASSCSPCCCSRTATRPGAADRTTTSATWRCAATTSRTTRWTGLAGQRCA